MIESLPADEIERILELGAWRDQGRRFAVGMHGKVFEYQEKEHQVGPRQRQGAAASAPPASSSASPASGAAANSEPGGTDGRKTLTEKYLGFRPEILLYYPSAHFREVDHGIWVTTRIYPLGLRSPFYWICLFLPDVAAFSPKAFAFYRLSPVPRLVGRRHTNFPDASICAFTDEDDAWRPGDNPRILLNLYAEWLICQLYLRLGGHWPGRQMGLDATYRTLEFTARDWCDCGSEKRYGDCCQVTDQLEVAGLKKSGAFVPLPRRVVPSAIVAFAKSRWNKLPDLNKLPFHPYAGQPPRS
jgi:hypothetical protein